MVNVINLVLRAILQLHVVLVGKEQSIYSYEVPNIWLMSSILY